MMKFLVLLIGACAWLAAERHSLTERMTTLEGKAATIGKQNSDLDAQLAVLEGRSPQVRGAATGAPARTWLQDRIDASLSRLETSDRNSCPTGRVIRRYENGYPVYSTTVNYNNTYNVAPRAPQPTPRPPAKSLSR